MAALLLASAYALLIAALEFGESRPRFDAIPKDAGVDAIAPGFLFGAATSAHQVEGGNRHNDWFVFERKAGKIRDATVSGAAADHWNRVREDSWTISSGQRATPIALACIR